MPKTATRRDKKNHESRAERWSKLYQLILYYDCYGTRLYEYPVTTLLEECMHKSGLVTDVEQTIKKSNGTELTVYKSPPWSVMKVTREVIPTIRFNTNYYENEKSEQPVTANHQVEPYWLALEKKLVIPNHLALPGDIEHARTSLEKVCDSQRQFLIVKVLGVADK